jgi:hypothetical protein
VTPQLEKFAQCLAAGMKKSDAYRAAHPGIKSSNKTIHETACKLAKREDVQARVEELRAPVIAKVRYELEQAMAECDEAIRLAKETANPSAMVSAVQLKAKLNGLLVEDRKNRRAPLEDLSDEQLDGLIQRRATELGVTLQ